MPPGNRRVPGVLVEIEGDVTPLSKSLDTARNYLKQFGNLAQRDTASGLIVLTKATEDLGRKVEVMGQKSEQAGRKLGTIGRANVAGIGRLQNAIQNLAQEAIGADPKVAKVATTLGTLGAGSALVTGVLAGIGLIVAGYNKVTEAARKRREEEEGLLRVLRDRLKAERPGSESTQAQINAALARGAEISAQLAQAEGDLARARERLRKTPSDDASGLAIRRQEIALLEREVELRNAALSDAGRAVTSAQDIQKRERFEESADEVGRLLKLADARKLTAEEENKLTAARIAATAAVNDQTVAVATQAAAQKVLDEFLQRNLKATRATESLDSAQDAARAFLASLSPDKVDDFTARLDEMVERLKKAGATAPELAKLRAEAIKLFDAQRAREAAEAAQRLAVENQRIIEASQDALVKSTKTVIDDLVLQLRRLAEESSAATDDAVRNTLDAQIANAETQLRDAKILEPLKADAEDFAAAAKEAIEQIKAGDRTAITPLSARFGEIAARTREAKGIIGETGEGADALKAIVADLFGEWGNVVDAIIAARGGQKSQHDIASDALDTARAHALVIRDAASAALQLAEAFGIVDENTSRSLQSVIQIGTSIGPAIRALDKLKEAKGAQRTAALGDVVGSFLPIASGLASLLGPLLGGESPEEKAHRDALREAAMRLRELATAAGDLAGSSLTGRQFGAARSAAASLLERARRSDFGEDAKREMRELERAADALGVPLDKSVEGIRRLADAMAIADFKAFASTFEGAMSQLDATFRAFGITDPAQQAEMRKGLLASRGGSTFAGIAGLEGDALIARLQEIFAALVDGGIELDTLGDLSLEQAIAQTVAMIEAERELGKERQKALQGIGRSKGGAREALGPLTKGDILRSELDSKRSGFRILGITDPADQINGILDALARIAPSLAASLKGVDFNTPEGREAVQGILRGFFNALATGSASDIAAVQAQFGGLDVPSIIAFIEEFLGAMDEVPEPVFRARNALEELKREFGTIFGSADPIQQLTQLAAAFGATNADLARLAEGLDLTSADGIATFQERLKSWYTDLKEAGPEALGMTQEEFDALIEALFGLASASESASAAVAAATKAEQDRARAAKELSDDVEVRKLRLQGNDDEADRRALQLDQERRRAEAKKLKDLELLKSLEELFRLESEDLEKRIAGRRNGDGAGAGSRGSAGAGSRDAIASGARGLSEQTGNRLADYTLVSVGELRQLNTTQLAALDVLRQLLSMPMGGLTPPSWSPYSIQGNNNTIIQQRFSITINFYGPVTDGGREVARLTGQETKKQIGAGVDQYLGGQAAAKKATVGDNAI